MSNTSQEDQTTFPSETSNYPNRLRDIRDQLYLLIGEARSEGWELSYSNLDTFLREMYSPANRARRLRLMSESHLETIDSGRHAQERINATCTEIVRRAPSLARRRRSEDGGGISIAEELANITQENVETSYAGIVRATRDFDGLRRATRARQGSADITVAELEVARLATSRAATTAAEDQASRLEEDQSQINEETYQSETGTGSLTPGVTQIYPTDFDATLPQDDRIQFNLSNWEAMLRLLREDTQAYDTQRDDELWREYR